MLLVVRSGKDLGLQSMAGTCHEVGKVGQLRDFRARDVVVPQVAPKALANQFLYARFATASAGFVSRRWRCWVSALKSGPYGGNGGKTFYCVVDLKSVYLEPKAM